MSPEDRICPQCATTLSPGSSDGQCPRCLLELALLHPAGLNPGDRLGTFEILGLLGLGGMGEVYRARDTKLGREVAVKVLHKAFAKDTERLARFEREARVLAALDHPHIGVLHDFQEDNGVRFLVMQLVEGETLADRIARGFIPVVEALPLFVQIAKALEAAHGRGIIHRDLKPANIKITESVTVKVVDFGMATSYETLNTASQTDSAKGAKTPPDSKITADGAILGTPAYASPEQGRGEPLDQRADLWAFGCCLYEALTGDVPFYGDTIADTLRAVLNQEPDWGALPDSLPDVIHGLLRRCLEKKPSRRISAAGDIASTLQAAVDLTPESRTQAVRARSPTGRMILGLAAGIAATVIVALVAVRDFGPPVTDVAPTFAVDEEPAIRAALVEKPNDPHLHFLLGELLFSQSGQGPWGQEIGNLDGAIAGFREMFANDPSKVDQAQAYDMLEVALLRKGDRKGAFQTRSEELEWRPDNPGTLESVAWYLATADDPADLDPEEAVRLARRITEINPESGWQTLGVALCQAGEWRDSVTALNRSIEIGSGGDAWDWVFLAMAEYRLGHLAAARTWLEKAKAQRIEDTPHDRSEMLLGRFLDEAEILLLSHHDPDRGNHP